MFKKACDSFPYLFKFELFKSGYQRLNINVARFTTFAELSDIPNYSGYPAVFKVREELSKAKEFDAKFFFEDPDLEVKNGTVAATQMANDELGATLQEVVVDFEALKAHQRKTTNKEEKALLKKYIGRLNSHGVDDEKYPGGKVLAVPYVVKGGRLFAVGISQQSLSNTSRAICAGAGSDSCNTLDADFVNCVIAVLVLLAKENGLQSYAKVLGEIHDKVDAFRAFLMGYYDISKKDAKQLLYRGVFGATPHDGNPLLWALAKEAYDLGSQLLALPEY